MRLTAVFVLPRYSGVPWPKLPALTRSAGELAALLEDLSVAVHSPRVGPVDPVAQMLADSVSDAGEPLFVYVGGHGIVEQRRHYTTMDATPPHAPSSRNALWSQQLAELLAGHGRDVLLVLDSCFAGEGAVGIASEAASALAEIRAERAFGVIASCRAFESAEDGMFVQNLLSLLRHGPRHDINAWGPGDERIWTGALLLELRHLGCRVEANLDAAMLRLLPNPRWNAAEREGRVDVKARLRRLSPDAAAHLIEKSAGFVGRANVRREVAGWLASGDRGTFVITGGPGTGKSALMGVLARQSVGDRTAAALDDAPVLAPGTFDVVVHARQKTLEAIRDELSEFDDEAPPRTILVDALDEAVAGEAPGIAAFLGSLARANAAIVVGTRPDAAVSSAATAEDALLRELNPRRLYRLDDLDDETTQADIAAMVRAALLYAEDSPYRAAGVPVDAIAALAASLTSPSFLLAQATARWLCKDDRAISDAPGWREKLARSAGEWGLGELIEDDLAARVPDDLERVRDLLRAAAWTEGLGMPRYTVWPSFAEELSPSGTLYTDRDVTWLLDKAGWYLAESSEDGQSVYRVFHQALIDHFRSDTRGRADDVQARLSARLHAITTNGGGWERADAYIRHYLIAHAEQSSAVDDSPSSAASLFADLGFLAHANADRLARAARRLRGRIQRAHGQALLSCMHLLEGLQPPERLALLELTALQEQLVKHPDPPASRAPWWPIFARWRPSGAHVTLAGHDGAVWSVAFSLDGRTLASGSDDCTVRLWDPITGALEQTLSGHSRPAKSVVFSPDGSLIASGGHDGTVRVWDAATGRHRRTIATPGGSVRPVAFSPDAALLAAGRQDGTVWLWDPITGAHAATFAGGGGLVRALAFSSDGAMIAAAGIDRTISLWDRKSGTLRTLVGHEDSLLAIAFSPCGATLASAGDDATIRLWDPITGKHETSLTGHNGPVRGLAYSRDGARLASAGDDGTVRLWDARNGTHLRTLAGHDGYVRAVAYAPDARTLASGGHDRTVRLWQTAGGARDPMPSGHERAVLAVAFSTSGSTLASSGDEGAINLWDAISGRHKLAIRGHDGAVRTVAFSSGAAALASGGDDGTVRLWDPVTGEHRLTLVGHEDWVRAISFSPDATTLASAGRDRTIRLWDATTGEDRPSLDAGGSAVRSLAFSSDGATLAGASRDGMVRLWDTATNALVGVVPVRSTCNCLVWSRHQRLAIATHAGLAVIQVR